MMRCAAEAMVRLAKHGADAETVHALSGELYATPRGWVMLRVPAALVQGIFDAIDETGIELPGDRDGRPLRAHISVMRPEETQSLGGAGKISERGHHFHYTLGPIKAVDKPGHPAYSKVWMVGISSPELMQLRRSYGLGPPKYAFHLTVAVRRPSVLYNNPISKLPAPPR
jgi:hypothetical protein